MNPLCTAIIPIFVQRPSYVARSEDRNQSHASDFDRVQPGESLSATILK